MTDQTTAIGIGTSLPVLAVNGALLEGQPLDRRTARVLRRASRVLAALRAAGVHGTAEIDARGRSFLGLQTLDISIVTGPDRTEYLVSAETHTRGRVSGPLGESVVVGVRGGRGESWGAQWVDIDLGPVQTRRQLLAALASALARRVWEETTTELGKGARVRVSRLETEGLQGVTIVDTNGPAGHVVAHVSPGGTTSSLSQRTGSSWSRGEGAFGLFLLAEFRTALEVDHEADVLGPFMARLTTTARTCSGLPALTVHED